MPKPVEESLQIIQSAKKDVNSLLKGTEHSNNLLEINALFQRLETKFRFMGAVTEPEMNGKETTNLFPPITNFMGKAVEVSKKIERSELTPKEDEKQKFRDDVQKLYGKIRELTPAQVLNAYTLPEHISIVRGVAKVASVEDFETKEIDVAFIEEIQLAIEEKEESGEKQKLIDKAAGKKPVEGQPMILTQAAIDADPLLQKQNAKAGDELITAADGKVTLKRKKS